MPIQQSELETFFMESVTQALNMDEEIIQNTISALVKHGIDVVLVGNRSQALDILKNLIPEHVDVMTGSSTTLEQIGFINYLMTEQHNWNNLRSEILAQKDIIKYRALKRKALLANYFVASINAITANGELVAVDGGGSRVGAFPFAAEKLILVSGTNKIVPTLNDAFRRIREYVYPLENNRTLSNYNFSSSIGKWVIIENENVKGRITLILVKEELGF